MIGPDLRRNIIDNIEIEGINWSGRLNDFEFLSRLYDLKSMSSHDRRFSDAAGDIWQHTVNNTDYENNWVFFDIRFNLLYCADEIFLKFLAEMVHPVIRTNVDETIKLINLINNWLNGEGWELVECTRINNQPLYSFRHSTKSSQLAVGRAKKIATKLDSDYISQQMIRLEVAAESDPELAIGTAKEFVETVCKTVLGEHIEKIDEIEFLPLVKKTLKYLKLVPDEIQSNTKAAETVRVLLKNLAAITHGLTELRNWHGTGHGKHAKVKGLQLRHARLAVGAASTLALFILDTNEFRKLEK
jgi:hypothetical protein